MQRILTAGILGAIAIYIWGAISWTQLPWHNMTLHELEGSEKIVQVLKEKNATTGVYMYPQADERQAQAQEAAAGTTNTAMPLALVFYNTNGINESATTFILGFVLSLIVAIIAAYLLSLASPKLPRFGQRVTFVVALGVFAALVSHGSFWNWMGASTDYSLVMVVDTVVTWLIGGLVIAAVIKPQTA